MPGRWPDQTLDQAFGLPEGSGRRPHLASVLQEGRENAIIAAGLGFIWRISVKTAAPLSSPAPPYRGRGHVRAPSKRCRVVSWQRRPGPVRPKHLPIGSAARLSVR